MPDSEPSKRSEPAAGEGEIQNLPVPVPRPSEVAREAGAKKLVLFHIDAEADAEYAAAILAEAKKEFANAVLAKDGMRLVV